MAYLVFILLITLFKFHSSIDARSIKQDIDRQIVNGEIDNNYNHAIALASYRHRFEHLPNLNIFRRTIKHNYDANAYCEACNILVPAVSKFSFIFLCLP